MIGSIACVVAWSSSSVVFNVTLINSLFGFSVVKIYSSNMYLGSYLVCCYGTTCRVVRFILFKLHSFEKAFSKLSMFIDDKSNGEGYSQA